MCQGGFLSRSPSNAGKFIKDLAEKIMQWKTTRDASLNSRYNGTRGDTHAVSHLSHLESRFATLENMIKGLVLHQSAPSHTLQMCSQCHVLDHTLSTCPYFAHHLASGQEQLNMAY